MQLDADFADQIPFPVLVAHLLGRQWYVIDMSKLSTDQMRCHHDQAGWTYGIVRAQRGIAWSRTGSSPLAWVVGGEVGRSCGGPSRGAGTAASPEACLRSALWRSRSAMLRLPSVTVPHGFAGGGADTAGCCVCGVGAGPGALENLQHAGLRVGTYPPSCQTFQDLPARSASSICCMRLHAVDMAVCLPVRAGICAGSVRKAACNTENPKTASAGGMPANWVSHQATQP